MEGGAPRRVRRRALPAAAEDQRRLPQRLRQQPLRLQQTPPGGTQVRPSPAGQRGRAARVTLPLMAMPRLLTDEEGAVRGKAEIIVMGMKEAMGSRGKGMGYSSGANPHLGSCVKSTLAPPPSEHSGGFFVSTKRVYCFDGKTAVKILRGQRGRS